MKKVVTSLTAIAALAGIGFGSQAFAPKKPFANKVFIQPNGSGFLYTNVAPTGFICSPSVPTVACTLSTTATAAFFNANASSKVPANTTSPTQHPQVTQLESGSIYQSL
jgi:hypothetical protein